MLDQDDIHPLFAGAPATTEFRKLRKRLVRQTREALETYAMVTPRRPLARLPVGRQGQLHAARGADRAEVARPAAGRAPRLQPRPGPARLPGDGPAGLPRPAWASRTASSTATPIRSSPTRCPPAAPTAPSARACAAATSTASPARRAAPRSCSAITATTSSRPSCSTSSTAARSPRWPPKLRNEDGDLHRPAPARPRRRGRLRPLRRRDGLPDHPLRPLRQPGRPAARGDQAHARRLGGASSPGRRADPVPRPRPR